MQLRAAFLAERAIAMPDGTFMIWRGGINEFLTTAIPTPISLTLVLRVEMDVEEAARLHKFTLKVSFEGRDVLPASTQPLAMKATPGETRLYANILANLGFPVDREGEGYVQGTIDDDVKVPLVYFRVRRTPDPFFFTPGMPRS
ncbi:MAG TPA: hypothetical protein VKT20_03980 [Candidatus Dormibacteraeota bacterium]|nr:hypothetical protein [Candidatus Dormibacteraeota bacterium]